MEQAAKAPNILCLMTDRLHLGCLGAYGNSTIGTDAFDRLASESAVFDQYYAAVPSLPELYRAFFTGTDPASAPPILPAPAPEKKKGLLNRLLSRTREETLPNPNTARPLPSELGQAGYRTCLLTDSEEIAALGESAGFSKIEKLAPAPAAAAGEPEETAFFGSMVRAAKITERLAKQNTPFFLWIHLSGFGGNWDFPISAREEAREDESDPSPYNETVPPFLKYGPHDEPDYDAVRSIVETYAAGVRIWDASLEYLVSFLAESELFTGTALLLGSLRGFPLGEHRQTGFAAGEPELLYSETIHQPLLLRFPGNGGEAVRVPGLCGPADLYRALERLAGVSRAETPTLLEMAREETESIRSFLEISQRDASSPRRGVLTNEWLLLDDESAEPPKREIYLHPNDRWEVNEVADRCGEEVLSELAAKIRSEESRETAAPENTEGTL